MNRISILIHSYNKETNSKSIAFTDGPYGEVLWTDCIHALEEEKIKRVNDITSKLKGNYTFIFKSTDLKMDLIRNQMYTVGENITNLFLFDNGKIPTEVLSYADRVITITYNRNFEVDEDISKWLIDTVNNVKINPENIKKYLFRDAPGSIYTFIDPCENKLKQWRIRYEVHDVVIGLT
jgi:hypothetical protein